MNTPLTYAIEKIDDEQVAIKIIDILIEHGANIDECSAISSALYNDKKNILKHLIERGADVNYRDKKGRTPLTVACTVPSLEEIMILVESGANINDCDINGNNAINYACIFSYDADIIRYLVENGADINKKNKNGETAMHSARQFQYNVGVVNYLIEYGGDMSILDNNGNTPGDYEMEIDYDYPM